jgi:hypothetical protein
MEDINTKYILDFISEESSQLLEAKEHQERLTALYNSKDLHLFKDKWKALITQEKVKVFEQLYENYAQTLINKIETQFNKVFHASGGGERIDFVNPAHIAGYKEFIQPVIAYQNNPLDFFADNYVRLLLSEPSSIFLTYKSEDGDIRMELIDLQSVCNIKTYYKDITEVAFKRDEDTFWYVNNEFIYVVKDDQVVEQFAHEGFKGVNDELLPSTPACFVSNELVTHNNMVLRKSPLTDSLTDIEDYNVFMTFSKNYKAFSAFGKEVKPETRNSNNKKESKHSVNVDNKSGVPPMPPMTESRKNTSLFGEVIQIPFSLQTEDKVSNIKNLYFRIDGDTKLLEFQKQDLKDLENKILTDTLGGGFGYQEKSGNKTATEILASFDTQENNLLRVKSNAEYSLNGINSLSCAAYEDDFLEYKIDLGTQFFLKNESQLLEELKILKEVTNNEYVIREKISEIHKTHNPLARGKEDRFNLVYLLQPYANRSEKWVSENRKFLSDTFSLFLYDNFHTILGLFEAKAGKIENFGKEREDRYSFLFNEFYTFAQDHARQRESYSEGGNNTEDDNESQENASEA